MTYAALYKQGKDFVVKMSSGNLVFHFVKDDIHASALTGVMPKSLSFREDDSEPNGTVTLLEELEKLL